MNIFLACDCSRSLILESYSGVALLRPGPDMPVAHMQPSSWQFGGLQARLTSAQTEHNALQLGTGPGRNGRTWRVAKAQGAAMSPAGVEQPPPASLRRPTPTQPGSRNSAELARAGAEQTLLKNLTWTQLQSWCAARGTMVHHACFAHRDCLLVLPCLWDCSTKRFLIVRPRRRETSASQSAVAVDVLQRSWLAQQHGGHCRYAERPKCTIQVPPMLVCGMSIRFLSTDVNVRLWHHIQRPLSPFPCGLPCPAPRN